VIGGSFVLKFFNKKFLTDEHIKVLKDSRKMYAKDKIVKLGDNYVEVINFENRIKVFPKKDKILDMINNIERFDPHWNCVLHKSWDEFRNYRFEDLPKDLRNYMQKMDAYYFTTWLNKLTTSDDVERYDRAERRLFEINGDVSDEDFEKYVLLGNTIPNTLGKKAKDSARRSYKVVNDYIRTNIHRFTNFVTFTFASEKNKEKYLEKNRLRLPGEQDLNFDYVDAKDFELAKGALKKVMDSLRKTLKKMDKEFYYITVWELQKNGNYHFHILCSDLPAEQLYKVPSWLDFNFVENKVNDGKGLMEWTFGKSDVQAIKSPEKVTSYVSKYIIKSFLNVDENSYLEYLNKKKYFPSRNLDKPTFSYFDSDSEFDKEIDSLMLGDIVPFKRVFKNTYNDSLITKKIYTKVQKKESSSHEDSSLDEI
jgi:hypothetical protein